MSGGVNGIFQNIGGGGVKCWKISRSFVQRVIQFKDEVVREIRQRKTGGNSENASFSLMQKSY